MKTFSEYLSAYVAGCRISWQKAAQLCGVNRTLLSRYACGKRLPENMDKVKKIAKGLEMSPQQTEEFKILYQISKSGSQQYKALNLISQIFSGQNICHFSMPVRRKLRNGWQEVRMRRIYGQEEICEAATWLAAKSSMLRIQTGTMEKGSLLFSILADAGCRIEHIVQVGYGNHGKTAAEELEKLLPFLFCGKKYQVYCDYQWFREECRYVTAMHIMLGDQGLLLISEDFTRGIYTSQPEYREYYEKMYLDKVKRCRIFGAGGLSAIPEFLADGFLLKNTSSGITFAYQDLPQERIWVKKEGDAAESFYLEEAELVKLFKIFMEYAGKWGGGVEASRRSND